MICPANAVMSMEMMKVGVNYGAASSSDVWSITEYIIRNSETEHS